MLLQYCFSASLKTHPRSHCRDLWFAAVKFAARTEHPSTPIVFDQCYIAVLQYDLLQQNEILT